MQAIHWMIQQLLQFVLCLKMKPPTILATNNIYNVPEDKTIGSYLSPRINASDPETPAAQLTYIFTGVPGQAPFEVETDGEIKLTGPLDFENGNIRYLLSVKVQDPEKLENGPVDVEINVVDANDRPTISPFSSLSISFDENTVSAQSIQFTDDDDGGDKDLQNGVVVNLLPHAIQEQNQIVMVFLLSFESKMRKQKHYRLHHHHPSIMKLLPRLEWT